LAGVLGRRAGLGRTTRNAEERGEGPEQDSACEPAGERRLERVVRDLGDERNNLLEALGELRN